MKTKHTKGNWKAFEKTEFWEVHTDLEEKHLCLNIMIFGKDENDQLTDLHLTKENEANAKLIAAAPDLLEALMNIENDNNIIPKPIWDMRNKAIEKATNLKIKQ